MAKAGITWTVSPETLARNIEKYGDRVMAAVKAVAEYADLNMVDYAKQNAPWEDRTGNARAAISGSVEMANDIVTLYLYQGMDYGKWLELCNSGKYAIILPTLESHYNEVKRMLNDLFK